MRRYLDDPDFTLYQGDALEVLRTLPDESIHMCVTSPPYWGLRCYGVEGQMGLEPTPELYIERMVEVFREVRRVLRSDGTCWLNIGDSYASGLGSGLQGKTGQRADRTFTAEGMGKPIPPGLKSKDLCMIPARLALALQADGWWLRSEITWCKRNCMPESVTDRPTSATEKIYLLTRSPRYYFDAEAVREPHSPDGRAVTTLPVGPNSHPNHAGRDGNERWPGTGRNMRNFWLMATEPFPEAHFATYPQELVRRCILAGTSERGCCPECGAPWVREVEATGGTIGKSWHDHTDDLGEGASQNLPGSPRASQWKTYRRESKGWHPSCAHDLEPIPCTVLDPFMGSGTTALVARKLGRRCIGVELSREYCELAAKRTQQLSLEATA